jgi:signal transduction histidine kinase
MDRMYNVLYVDDEVSNLNVFKNTFRRNYNIFTADSAKAGLEILDKERIDLILTDQRMPEMSGVDFLKSVMMKYPEPSRILITAFTDFSALKDAVNEARIFQYIQKPWEKDEIKNIIDNALEIRYLKQKNQYLTEELKSKNEQLEKLNKELIDLDKIKFQFLHIISHEIRTPLNGLIGATSLFKDELIDHESLKHKELFILLENSVQRLAHFLLLAERITAFKATRYIVNPEVVDVYGLVKQVADGAQERIKNKGLKLELDLFPQGNDICYAEKQLIEICLSEILDNAIKHLNPGGEVTVSTKSRDDQVIIEIADSGPGFPQLVLSNVFKVFITDEDITKQGMGLDLALINLIVEAHQGKMFIWNNERGGATVQLIFEKCSAEPFINRN